MRSQNPARLEHYRTLARSKHIRTTQPQNKKISGRYNIFHIQHMLSQATRYHLLFQSQALRSCYKIVGACFASGASGKLHRCVLSAMKLILYETWDCETAAGTMATETGAGAVTAENCSLYCLSVRKLPASFCSCCTATASHMTTGQPESIA